MFARCIDTYHRAETMSKRYGFIGRGGRAISSIAPGAMEDMPFYFALTWVLCLTAGGFWAKAYQGSIALPAWTRAARATSVQTSTISNKFFPARLPWKQEAERSDPSTSTIRNAA